MVALLAVQLLTRTHVHTGPALPSSSRSETCISSSSVSPSTRIILERGPELLQGNKTHIGLCYR